MEKKDSKRNKLKWVFLVLALVVSSFFLWRLFSWAATEKIEVNSTQNPTQKTVETQWNKSEVREWFTGILLPLVIGGGGYLLNRSAESRSESEKAERIAKVDREEKEQREQAELRDYYDRITTLVIENALTKSDADKDVNRIAQGITANILRQLSTERMNQVMELLDALCLSGKKDRSSQVEAFMRGEEGPSEENLPNYKSILSGINFTGADLRGIDANHVDFGLANFSNADLRQSNFIGADLSGVDFENLSENSSNLEKADFSGANFSCTTFENIDFRKVKGFQHAQFEKTSFEKCTFSGMTIGATLFKKVKFVNCIFDKTTFIGTDFEGSSFESVDLSESEFIGAKLRNTKIIKPTFKKTKFFTTDFTNADLIQSDMNSKEVELIGGVVIKNTKLNENIEGSNLRSCEIYEPIIKN